MKPQFIKTDDDELVVLRRRDYDALIKRTRGSKSEDEGVARIIARSNASLDAGNDVELPASVAEAIARGKSPLRVIREWRDHTQTYLAYKTNIDQSTISALENGTRRGTTAVWKRLAAFLEVPMGLLIPD